MIILIDNYDSFTFNIYHYLSELGAKIKVYRNDKISIPKILKIKPKAIILSPGPCTPNEAGICLNLVNKTTIQDLCYLARGATLAIGNDTGPMHAFTMSGCNSLVLFSSDSNPIRCAPRPFNKKKKVEIIQKKLIYTVKDLRLYKFLKLYISLYGTN